MSTNSQFIAQMFTTSRGSIEYSVKVFMGTSGTISVFINIFGIYLICFHHGMMDDYRFYLLYFQTILLIFDVYFSILMVPIPLFPIISGYTIGVLSRYFEVSTHHQMVFALWCVGNTNTCIFLSLLKRHQVVAGIEQKKTFPTPMLVFSRVSSNLLPLLGTIAFAFSEPDQQQKHLILEKKYPSLSTYLIGIPGLALYDIDLHLNPSFFYLTLGIMCGTLMLSSAYSILYGQLYVMLKSLKRKISIRSYTKHSIAVFSTIMQNLVFIVFFISPIFLLAIVIYSGFDASGACIIMVCVFSLHSSANTLVMCFTFRSFRRVILTSSMKIIGCREKSPVSPANHISVRIVQTAI